ncbi:MAG: hypothetical protein AAF467_16190, partial [Actinomycetota bacterium]
MLVGAMVLAALYGVLQLAILGSAARSVRLSTLLLALGAGAYGSAVASVLVQFAVTRLIGLGVDTRMTQIVNVAGYTTNPFIEEGFKVAPLLLVGLWPTVRRQWGLTDYVLVGAAIGAGFGLLEAVMRFGTIAGEPTFAASDGWWVMHNLIRVEVAAPDAMLGRWLPPPVSGENVLFPSGGQAFSHLIWGSVNGLGAGLLLRERPPWRLVGVALILMVGADHASTNYAATAVDGNSLGDGLTWLFRTAQPVANLWPLLVLMVAVVRDRIVLAEEAARHPELGFGDRPTSLSDARGVARLATARLPWTAALAARLVLVRRAARYSSAQGDDRLIQPVTDVRLGIDAANDRNGWRNVDDRLVVARWLGLGDSRRLWRRAVPLVIWLILIAPAVAYYAIGSTPAAADTQDWFAEPGPAAVLAAIAGLGLVWIGWQIATSWRAVRRTTPLGVGDLTASLVLRVLLGSGALTFAAITGLAWLRGAAPDERVIDNFHVLAALAALLVVAGIALVAAALIFYFPLVPVVVAGAGGGTGLLVVSTGTGGTFAALGATGLLATAGGLTLQQAIDDGAFTTEVYASREGAGRGDAHGDGGRALER